MGPTTLTGLWGDQVREVADPGKRALQTSIERLTEMSARALQLNGDVLTAEGCLREALELVLVLRQLEGAEQGVPAAA